VVRVTHSGVIEDVISGLVVPTAMTFGSDGALYVSNFGAAPAGAGQIWKYGSARLVTRRRFRELRRKLTRGGSPGGGFRVATVPRIDRSRLVLLAMFVAEQTARQPG